MDATQNKLTNLRFLIDRYAEESAKAVFSRTSPEAIDNAKNLRVRIEAIMCRLDASFPGSDEQPSLAKIQEDTSNISRRLDRIEALLTPFQDLKKKAQIQAEEPGPEFVKMLYTENVGKSETLCRPENFVSAQPVDTGSWLLTIGLSKADIQRLIAETEEIRGTTITPQDIAGTSAQPGDVVDIQPDDRADSLLKGFCKGIGMIRDLRTNAPLNPMAGEDV